MYYFANKQLLETVGTILSTHVTLFQDCTIRCHYENLLLTNAAATIVQQDCNLYLACASVRNVCKNLDYNYRRNEMFPPRENVRVGTVSKKNEHCRSRVQLRVSPGINLAAGAFG